MSRSTSTFGLGVVPLYLTDQHTMEDNGFKVRILSDVYNMSAARCRLTTWELTYPRCIHSELLTHRVFSRNSASSRAIPVEKMIERVVTNPFVPIYWGKNQRGMQANEEINEWEREFSVATWYSARDSAVEAAKSLMARGLHKQLVNRLLEPWMWITTILTGTDFDNFYTLRCHETAEPHFQKLARMMKTVHRQVEPYAVAPGEFALPLTSGEDVVFADTELVREPYSTRDLLRLSTARCARVSYLTHDGKREPDKDFRLHDNLLKDKHMSPFEHPAMALSTDTRVRNFQGFVPYREFV